VPVEEVDVVVMAIGELPAPPGGGVIGEGNVKLTPVGALPTHPPENVTGELNPPIEATIIVVELLKPCIMETEGEEAEIEKSGKVVVVVVVVAAAGTTTTLR
jgi:hypothetical protein